MISWPWRQRTWKAGNLVWWKRNAGKDLILKGPFGSPHGQSLDLIGSDDTKPELEGFVMQTDDKPTSIAGRGNSFDESNLPSTTIEHPSILERLCQSACMQTAVAWPSASYNLVSISCCLLVSLAPPLWSALVLVLL
ncbi:hypothetical protein ACFX1W_005605 [Malus domestica]